MIEKKNACAFIALLSAFLFETFSNNKVLVMQLVFEHSLVFKFTSDIFFVKYPFFIPIRTYPSPWKNLRLEKTSQNTVP